MQISVRFRFRTPKKKKDGTHQDIVGELGTAIRIVFKARRGSQFKPGIDPVKSPERKVDKTILGRANKVVKWILILIIGDKIVGNAKGTPVGEIPVLASLALREGGLQPEEIRAGKPNIHILKIGKISPDAKAGIAVEPGVNIRLGQLPAHENGVRPVRRLVDELLSCLRSIAEHRSGFLRDHEVMMRFLAAIRVESG